MLIFYIPFAYLGMIVIGVPYCLILRRFNKLSLSSLVLGGLLSSLLFGVLFEVVTNETYKAKFDVGYLWFFGPYSLVIALTWGLIVGVPLRSSSSN